MGGNKDERNINNIMVEILTLRKNLIDFTKEYYPNTYNDFNDITGMMFLEIYVGDVMSFYDIFQRVYYFEELETVYKIANIWVQTITIISITAHRCLV